jgi:hypothetical protein
MLRSRRGNKRIRNAEILILIVFFLINLRILNWFQPGYIVFSGDLRPPIVPNVFLQNALYSWNEIDWGIPSVYSPRILDPFIFLMTAFQTVGVNAYTSECLAIYFIYVLAAILMYVYIKRLTNGDILAAFVAAIFFTTNIYLIVDREQTAFLFMDMSLTILPCLVAFTEGMKKKSFGYMAISGFLFILTYAAFPSYRAPVLCAIALVMTLISLSITRSPIDSYTGIQRIDSTLARLRSAKLKFPKVLFDWSLIRKYAKHLGVFVAAILLASIWFFALIYANIHSLFLALSQTTTPVASAFGNKAPDVIRLIAEWSFYFRYYEQPYVPYAHVYLDDPVMIVLSYTPTILAFAAIFISKSRKLAIFFGSLAILFLLLTCGSSELFSQFYALLMDVIPLLRAFRTSTNWIFLLILTFSMLIGLFVSGLCQKIKIKALKILVIFLAIALLFYTTYPLITGEVTGNWLDLKNKGSYIPPYFGEADKAMSNQYWTIILPQRNVYDIYNFTDGGVLSIGNPYPLVFSKPFLSGDGTEYLQSPNRDLLTRTYGLIRSGGYGAFVVEEKAAASSFQVDRTPDLAIDGNYATRWASASNESTPQVSTPQWFKIDYNQTQELSSIRIYFEQAYAINYTIQTWNGNNWITQVKVENNTSLNPEYNFSQVIPTTKLRINFTGDFPWDLVSIYEVEINHQQYLQTEVVPKFLGMLGIKNLLVENNIIDGNLSDAKDLEILNKNPKFTLVHEWNGAAMYENAYSLEKFYPASNIITISNVSAPLYTLSEMYQIINDTAWSTLEHSAFVNSTSDNNWTSIGTLQTPENFVWTEISPTKYEVNTNSNAPFLLGFLENYDSNWKASVNGKPIPENNHVTVNDFANGWLINSTGNLIITVEYETQNLITASVVASIILLSALFALLLFRKNFARVRA